MSTLLWNGMAVSVTLFSGGAMRGTCIQITGPSGHDGYVQLTMDQAESLAKAILDAAKRHKKLRGAR